MEEKKSENTTQPPDIQAVVQAVIQEFMKAEQTKSEPAYKTELLEERKRRERLEQQVNSLVEENRRTKNIADEAERTSTIRAELQRLGVAKVDLAFKAVKDDIVRTEDGRLFAKTGQGEIGVKEYLSQFLNENPELLPARMTGGSGVTAAPKSAPAGGGFDLDKIQPGMKPEELERVRQEIARVASLAMRGQ